MIQNGRQIVSDPKKAAKIQDKINNIEQIPDTAKVEVTEKDRNELYHIISDGGDISGYTVQNNIFSVSGDGLKDRRKERYLTYEEMDEDNFIHRGLDIIADDSTQKNMEGHVYSNHSDDEEIKSIVDELFERIGIDKELWSASFETAKNGDCFYEVIPDSYSEPTMISRIRYLEPNRVNRIEKNGKLAFYTYIAENTDPDKEAFMIDDDQENQKIVYKLEPWQIIHFRVPNKKYYPYGTSLLDAGTKDFNRLKLLENGMVIRRLNNTPERKVFYIDTNGLPSNEAERYVKNIQSSLRTNQILDDKGNINKTAAAMALTQDYFIPVRQGSATKIESLPTTKTMSDIDDIKYFRDRILWTLNIPPERLGFTSDQAGAASGRGSLAMNDINFSRFIERHQNYLIEGLTKIAAIELFFKKKKKGDLKNFKIELTPPSNIKELMDVEFLSNKMNLIQTMNGTGLFPKKFILKYVMRMTDKEIDNITFFKDLEAQAGQSQENAMLGGMGGMPLGGDMGAGAPPPEAGAETPPASSVETSMEDFEDKIVSMFGKKVLIENKDEWYKILQAYNDYEENKIKEENNKKELEEQQNNIIEEDIDSYIVESLSKAMGYNDEKEKTNSFSSILITENELGGLDYKKHELNFFEKKKRTGPKSSKSPDVIYEEAVVKLD